MSSTRSIHQDHSNAKVDLFTKYLSAYLNILNKVPFIKSIHIYDLFAGEGMYEDGNKGSALRILETVKNHYFGNGRTCKKINIWLNDKGKSEVEVGKLKIDRVEALSNEIFCPPRVSKKFTSLSFNEVIHQVKREIRALTNSSRVILFLDPWGYKDIKPKELKEILNFGNCEVILFLPISFMYRFANKAFLDSNFAKAGGKPVYDFLTQLYKGSRPNFTSAVHFIQSLKYQFKGYLSDCFVTSYSIERDAQNTYCVYFFSRNEKGFEKMLEVIWSLDAHFGTGYSGNSSVYVPLFNKVAIENYDQKIISYLTQSGRTNKDLYSYGLDHGFLPKHTNEILSDLKNQGRIKVTALDGGNENGFYLSNKNRLVSIELLTD